MFIIDFIKEHVGLQHWLIIGAFTLFAMIVWLIKKGKIEVKYSIIWLAFSVVMIIFSLFPYIVLVLGDITGVVNPVNFVFLTQIIFILLIMLSLSAVVSGFSKKIKRLAQTNALLEKRVRELEEKLNDK